MRKRKCENANLRCECESAKKRSIDAMQCDGFSKKCKCDANAKMDSHYQPCCPEISRLTIRAASICNTYLKNTWAAIGVRCVPPSPSSSGTTARGCWRPRRRRRWRRPAPAARAGGAGRCSGSCCTRSNTAASSRRTRRSTSCCTRSSPPGSCRSSRRACRRPAACTSAARSLGGPAWPCWSTAARSRPWRRT